MAAKKAATKKAAPKKTAKKKSSVADSWAEGYRPLVEAAREELGFLVKDLGFTEPEVKISPPSAMITFQRGQDFVRVESEYMGSPFMAVRAGEGAPFGLAMKMTELDPAYAAQRPTPAGSALTPAEMRAAVAHDAAFLSRHRDLLNA
jgi:hypothetical protein